LAFLRTQDWLINDATLTFYVDKDIVGSDTTATPRRLFLYKDGTINNGMVENPAQILDLVNGTEGITAVGGNLTTDSDRNPDFYTFKITDYVSELISGNLNDLQPLGLKVINPTDFPVTLIDTIVRTYNWNPKAVMLLNNNAANGTRRAQLKISYSKKTEDN
jgi:hypothetical protein